MKTIRYYLEYSLFLLLSRLVGSFTASGAQRLGQCLGRWLYRLSGRRRGVAAINLDIAFSGRKSRVEKDRIAERSFMLMATAAVQCLWALPSPQKRVPQLIEGEPGGLDTLRACLSRRKGVFLLTAHYANWEIMGLYHGMLGIAPLSSIVRKLDNPFLDVAVSAFRTQSGNAILYKDQSPLKMVRALKNNGCVAVMMDQNMARGGIFVDFFGKKAATARSIALLHLSTGAAILPLFSYPTAEGKYKIKYGPELQFTPSGDKEEDVRLLTQQCAAFIESVIRETPEPWLWLHRRWKTRPPEDAAAVYPRR